VGDDQGAHVGPDQSADAAGDRLQGVDVETGVGLVEHREAGMEKRQLKYLDPLLLPSREAVVQIAAEQLARHLQLLGRRRQLLAELWNRDGIVFTAGARLAQRVHRRAQEARHRHARDRVGVLEGEEEPLLGALVGTEPEQAGAVQEHVAGADPVGGMPHQRVCERGLARAVRAHDRVHLAAFDREVDALDDFGSAVQRDVKIFYLE